MADRGPADQSHGPADHRPGSKASHDKHPANIHLLSLLCECCGTSSFSCEWLQWTNPFSPIESMPKQGTVRLAHLGEPQLPQLWRKLRG